MSELSLVIQGQDRHQLKKPAACEDRFLLLKRMM